MTVTQVGLFERHCDESGVKRKTMKQSLHVSSFNKFQIASRVLNRINSLCRLAMTVTQISLFERHYNEPEAERKTMKQSLHVSYFNEFQIASRVLNRINSLCRLAMTVTQISLFESHCDESGVGRRMRSNLFKFFSPISFRLLRYFFLIIENHLEIRAFA
ncbi:MAG: hypothetical protein ACJAZV_000030 [Roseivirga sp.]|jgi:hypothetical protein